MHFRIVPTNWTLGELYISSYLQSISVRDFQDSLHFKEILKVVFSALTMLFIQTIGHGNAQELLYFRISKLESWGVGFIHYFQSYFGF